MSENSTDDNSELVDMDDFNAFENALFQRPVKEAEASEAEEVDENDDNSVANDEDQPEDQDEHEADEAEAPKPDKKRKNPTQERIEKLVTEARVAEREAAALRLELEHFKASKEEVETKIPTPAANTPQLPAEAPQPNALNDKGEPVYPLGEFDPMFIKDLSTFYAKATIEHETKMAKEAALKEAQEKEYNTQKAKLQEQWSEKLEAVQETLPDYNENIQKLAVAFQGVDPQYGDYLASTVMQCDNGPEIMYYLSQNIGEAQKIVASGPLAATLAIGRLQAKFEVEDQPEQKSNKKVSQAPTPPPVTSRGKGGQFQVRPDTDDLAAFERDFFK